MGVTSSRPVAPATMDFWSTDLLRATEEMQMLSEMARDVGKILKVPDINLFSSREQFIDMLGRGGVFRHLINTYQRKKDHTYIILLAAAAFQLGLPVSHDHMKVVRTALEQTVMEDEKQEELRRLFGKEVTPEQCEAEAKEANLAAAMRRRQAGGKLNLARLKNLSAMNES